jgi:hypothetical protein
MTVAQKPRVIKLHAPVHTPIFNSAIAFAIALNLIGLAFTYGTMTQRVSTLESGARDQSVVLARVSDTLSDMKSILARMDERMTRPVQRKGRD